MSKIEWTNETWNPVRGCSRVSAGCDHCYAMGQAHRFSGAGQPYEGLTTIRRGKVDWTGTACLVPDQLEKPLRWKKPRRVFVNSMSDLFHESLSNEEIAAVFGVMASCPQHTFQCLTKRPKRMAEWFEWNSAESAVINRREDYLPQLYAHETLDDGLPLHLDEFPVRTWPLPNVWLGASVENQETADERIPWLLSCPAAVRFVSAEPLIGPLRLPWRWCTRCNVEPERHAETHLHCHDDGAVRRLDWVIAGGESGPKARPFDLAWARSLRDQCAKADVAFFMKQAGSNVVDSDRECGVFAPEDKHSIAAAKVLDREDNPPNLVPLRHRKGGDLSELKGNWPREFPA